ncbi:MAG TPA: threonine/serine dehydratase [Kineosporiaceae bacterium]|nr:threonine/serine dehydratase [Kineosporiaceae bacterium]
MERYWEWSGFVVRLVLERIRAAMPQIAPVFRGTPQYECEQLGARLGCRITLKVECLNPVRCFKGRGTEVVLARLVGGDGPRSVICASAGNLGQALAYSGRRRGIACTVVASATANPVKLRRMRQLGATVHLVDGDIEVARRTARDLADRDGMFLVEDSENLDTCEGAGTIGLEIVEAPEPFDAVLLAVGGGALVTGVGHVLKSLAPLTAVVGVQPAGAPAMTLSWRARRVVETETIDTIADGVAGRHPIPEVLDDLLVVADDVLLVGEDSIKAGMRLLYEHAGLVVEPSAALGVAAVLENRSRYEGTHVATVLCGGNVTPDDFRRWVID